MPYFALIIMYYHVKIARYHAHTRTHAHTRMLAHAYVCNVWRVYMSSCGDTSYLSPCQLPHQCATNTYFYIFLNGNKFNINPEKFGKIIENILKIRKFINLKI